MEYIGHRLFICVVLVLFCAARVQGVSCSSCGRDFQVLGRHTWRCQSRATDIEVPQRPLPPSSSAGAKANNKCNSTCQIGIPPTRKPTRGRSRRRRPKRVSQGLREATADSSQPTTTTTSQGTPVGLPLSPPNATPSCDGPTSTDTSRPSSYTTACDWPSAPPSPTQPLAVPSDKHEPDPVMCHCGRWCKWLCGLRAHQRSCRLTETLVGLDPSMNRVALDGSTALAAHAPIYTTEPCNVDLSLNLAALAAAYSNSSQPYGVLDISMNAAALASAYSSKLCGVALSIKLASLVTAYWAEPCPVDSEKWGPVFPFSCQQQYLRYTTKYK